MYVAALLLTVLMIDAEVSTSFYQWTDGKNSARNHINPNVIDARTLDVSQSGNILLHIVMTTIWSVLTWLITPTFNINMTTNRIQTAVNDGLAFWNETPHI